MEKELKLFQDYKEYYKECDSPCSFYNWLSDGIDNTFTKEEALQFINKLTNSFISDLNLLKI
jgi:hypothetical protein